MAFLLLILLVLVKLLIVGDYIATDDAQGTWVLALSRLLLVEVLGLDWASLSMHLSMEQGAVAARVLNLLWIIIWSIGIMAQSASKLASWLDRPLVLLILILSLSRWLDIDRLDILVRWILRILVILLPIGGLHSTTSSWTQSRWLMHQTDLVLHDVYRVHVLIQLSRVDEAWIIHGLQMIHICWSRSNKELLLVGASSWVRSILALVRGSVLLLHLHVAVFVLLIRMCERGTHRLVIPPRLLVWKAALCSWGVR